jgi:triacylglycerol lipase
MFSLLSNATDFELQNALHLAYLSELAYQNEYYIQQELASLYPKFQFLEVHPVSGYDTELFVAAHQEAIVVAFRGTEENSLEDWVNNIDNRAFSYQGGTLHQGFWEALEAIWKLLYKQIQDFRSNQQKIWLTGHSQGGALAMLAARRLVAENLPIQGVYTYGQPKVGDMLFAANYDSLLKNKTFRIYNEDDSVVNNPPKLYHAGMPVRVFKNGGFEIEYFQTMFETGDLSFTSFLDSLLDYATDSLQSHSISTYLQRLKSTIA